MRLFAALTPDAGALVHLQGALDSVQGGAGYGGARVRWVPRSNWHVTLAFFGEVGEAASLEIGEALAGIARTSAAFGLDLRGAGVFSGRTLWIGVGGQTARLQELSARCAKAWPAEAGRRQERNRGHLTVARASAPTAQLDEWVRVLSVYRGPSWQVGDLRLMRSYLGEGVHGHPRHEQVGCYPLGSQ